MYVAVRLHFFVMLFMFLFFSPKGKIRKRKSFALLFCMYCINGTLTGKPHHNVLPIPHYHSGFIIKHYLEECNFRLNFYYKGIPEN